MSRDIEFDNEWQALLKEIKLQLHKQNVLEDKLLQMKSNFGAVRGKFDIFKNRVLILISNQHVQEIFQNELLLQIYSHLYEIIHYQTVIVLVIQQINTTELELQQKYQIDRIIKKYEEKLNLSNIFSLSLPKINYLDVDQEQISKLKSFTCVTEENIETLSQYKQYTQDVDQKAFKGFLMYDLKKQYFLMLIRKGFNSDKAWVEERSRIEKFILSRQRQQSSILSMSTSFAQYLIQYDSQTKFYFILLSNNLIPNSPQYELLQRIRGFISSESNFQKQRKNEIESQYQYVVSDIIDAQERIYMKSKYRQLNPSIATIFQQQIKIYDMKKQKQELSLQQF
ncbi:unnamed protein product (macronuclear) [Paramecium tetraurelia]|uniref:Uncharacterized protein n=1 Tax=Paramecium tetraurelia TaxID=5888 RepID=A0CZR5_PARTE|nr:uncharacterized protein GSPATT00011855001 [Paramecium tetraurelia]CAK76282.1 unnamed protein product [Paramecium tetraurelia]|eukprot:XP_001443679.1 hypothetical protein (macronuclear) [Paramecium tetraurelia strain d4-2]